MKRLNLFHFAVIYVTAICSITSIPRYLILKGNSPHINPAKRNAMVVKNEM